MSKRIYKNSSESHKPHKMTCNICDSDIEEDNGDIVGTFGICPVAFCVWRMSSMTDMIIQTQGFDDIDTLEERIDMIKEDNKDSCNICHNKVYKVCNCKPMVNKQEII